MRNIVLSFSILFSTLAFPCPNISMTNLTCVESDGGQYTINSFSIQNSYVKALIAGEALEYTLPFNDGEAEYKCAGNSIVSTENIGSLSAKSAITFSSDSIEIKGTRFVYQCDEDCHLEDNFYISGTEAFADRCTKN